MTWCCVEVISQALGSWCRGCRRRRLGEHRRSGRGWPSQPTLVVGRSAEETAGTRRTRQRRGDRHRVLVEVAVAAAAGFSVRTSGPGTEFAGVDHDMDLTGGLIQRRASNNRWRASLRTLWCRVRPASDRFVLVVSASDCGAERVGVLRVTGGRWLRSRRRARQVTRDVAATGRGG